MRPLLAVVPFSKSESLVGASVRLLCTPASVTICQTLRSALSALPPGAVMWIHREGVATHGASY